MMLSRTMRLFLHDHKSYLKQITARGLVLFLGIILLSGSIFRSAGKASISISKQEANTQQLRVQMPGVGESLLLNDFRLQVPDYRMLYAIRVADSKDLVLTRSQAVYLLVVAYLRHPFYVFTSIHAP